MHMPCQSCKKQPASVHLTDISPEGEKTERHLCEKCAVSEGVAGKSPSTMPVNEILSGLVIQKAAIQQLADLTCSKCKMTFVEFRNGGLLGCACDYDAFEKALLPLIERAHEGSSHHIGKVPRRLATPRPLETDLVRLRSELSQAVTDEQYERAARIRDQIRTLEER